MHTMESYSALKRNELSSHTATWMDFKGSGRVKKDTV